MQRCKYFKLDLTLWLDADPYILQQWSDKRVDANRQFHHYRTSGAVSQWNDKSGNGTDLTSGQNSGSKTIHRNHTLGGKNILNFSGDDYDDKHLFSVSQPDMIVMVARANGTVDNVLSWEHFFPTNHPHP